MVSKSYFREWLSLKCKINLPLICFSSFVQCFTFVVFVVYDIMLTYIENNHTGLSCQIPTNRTTCFQELFALYENFCSPSYVFVSVGFLLTVSGLKLLRFVKVFFVSATKFKHLVITPFGKKQLLAGNISYFFFQEFANLCIIVNIVVRFVRLYFDVNISIFVDTGTFFVVHLGTLWGFLCVIQLVPYFGYVATAVTVMVFDVFVFTVLMMSIAFPYFLLIEKVINSDVPADQCDPNWSHFVTSSYSTFLLLFTMDDFRQAINNNYNNMEYAQQIYVSSFSWISSALLVNFLIVLLGNPAESSDPCPSCGTKVGHSTGVTSRSNGGLA